MEIAVALIGLAGTLLAAGLGYRQWQRSARSAAPLAQDRGNAARELWERLQQAHLDLRAGRSGATRESLRELNQFLIAKTPYLDRDLSAAAGEYLTALIRLNDLIAASEDEELQDRWEITSPDLATPNQIEEIMAASADCEAKRDLVVARVQAALA